MWFVPSIIGNAVAVRRSSCPPETLHIAYILFLGIDNWPRPRSNVPTPCLAHDANPTALAPHWLCRSSDGDRDGWLCWPPLHHGLAGVQIWDWIPAATVSTIHWLHVISGTNCSFYLLSFSTQNGIHDGRDADCVGVRPRSCQEGGLRRMLLREKRISFSPNFLNEKYNKTTREQCKIT